MTIPFAFWRYPVVLISLSMAVMTAFAGEEQLRTHSQKEQFDQYQKGKNDRAFALSGSGGFGWAANRRGEKIAREDALKECKKHVKAGQEPCVLVNVNGHWSSATGGTTAAPAGAAKSHSDRLGSVWRESENGWTGVWTRRPNSNVFDAVWTKGGKRITAELTMTVMNQTSLSIHRKDTSDKLEFMYTGTLGGNGTAKGVGHVKGQEGQTWAWSATIK